MITKKVLFLGSSPVPLVASFGRSEGYILFYQTFGQIRISRSKIKLVSILAGSMKAPSKAFLLFSCSLIG